MELGHQTALAVLQSTHYESVCMTMVGIFHDCLSVTIHIAHTCSDDNLLIIHVEMERMIKKTCIRSIKLNQVTSHHFCVSNGRMFILFTKWKPKGERTEHRAGTSHWKSSTTSIQPSLPDKYIYFYSLICTDNNSINTALTRHPIFIMSLHLPQHLNSWGHTAYILIMH